MESILNSVKKMLGMPEDYTAFDSDLIIHINSVIAILTQLGVGSYDGFKIKGKETTWEDYLGDDPMMDMAKSYLYLKVRLIFDPPSISSSLQAMEKQAVEMEWRINSITEGDYREE